MKFTATKDNLSFAVTAVQKAVSTKSSLAVLTCIKIEAQGNMLYFSATDLEMGIQCNTPADVSEEGVIIVPARYFAEIVKKLPDSLITIYLANDNKLIINFDQSQLTLNTLPPDDFPNIPDFKGENVIEVNSAILKKMIRQTVFAAGVDEFRPLFTGILCEVKDNILRMIATDTHRLALRQGTPQKNPDEDVSFIVPAKMLSEVARLIYEDDETCYICLYKNLVSFTIANIRIICRLLDGQFPDYKQVIPVQYKTKALIKVKNLQNALDRVSLFTMSNDNSNTIHINVENNLITASSQSELGQGYEQLNIETEGIPVMISFNARYLLDVFKILESETATIEFTGPLSPCIIRPTENDNFLYLVLPVRS